MYKYDLMHVFKPIKKFIFVCYLICPNQQNSLSQLIFFSYFKMFLSQVLYCHIILVLVGLYLVVMFDRKKNDLHSI
jgi:hypothetical protein